MTILASPPVPAKAGEFQELEELDGFFADVDVGHGGLKVI